MKTYSLSQTGFDQLRTRLLANGITLPTGTDGEISYKGIRLKYHFDPAKQQMTLAILEKPFIAPSAMIWEKVDQWIAG
jgi:hypothetical protein